MYEHPMGGHWHCCFAFRTAAEVVTEPNLSVEKGRKQNRCHTGWNYPVVVWFSMKEQSRIDRPL